MSNYSISLSLEEYFQDNPLETEEYKVRHDAISQAALSFAKIVEENVQDEDLYKMAIHTIQQAKVLAQQGVRIDELKQKK